MRLSPQHATKGKLFQAWPHCGHAVQVITKLHSILKPFLLRRVKSDVENSLPGKKELILYADMTQQQRDFNEELRQNTLNVSSTCRAVSTLSAADLVHKPCVHFAVNVLHFWLHCMLILCHTIVDLRLWDSCRLLACHDIASNPF